MVGNDIGTYAATQLESVHGWHHHIGDDDIGHECLCLVDALLTVGGKDHLEVGFEHTAYVGCHVGIVLNDKGKSLSAG